ncbi:hypothetical protein ACFLRM_00825 [Acidobacteriota bacterium]
MTEIFNLLIQKEKKILGVLCLLLVCVFVFYFVAQREKNTYLHEVDSLSAKEGDFKKISEIATERENEWRKWQEAQIDLDELREDYFFSNKDGFKQIRLDLQKMFNQARINAPQMKFNYVDFEEEKIKKTIITFDVTGTYFSLKKFIHTIEEFPKLLVIEKIDFQDIDPEEERLKLRFILAGYYEIE